MSSGHRSTTPQEAFSALALRAQALRRLTERLRSPVGGAEGVRARLLPHQLANAHRVLTDICVRHLLADEVGLGKTIQALMVLNALRLQRPALRALIVIPAQLHEQWETELLSRAHVAAGPQRGVILMTGDEASAGLIDPDAHDLLIVDELHKLSAAVRAAVAAKASAFEHVLLMTATPGLKDPRRLCELAQVLEPHRVAAALRALVDEGGAGEDAARGPAYSWPEALQRAVIARLHGLDARAAAALAGDDRDARDALDALGDLPGRAPARAAALAWALGRRVLRARRGDYRGLLPGRLHKPWVIEPTDAEQERQRLVWRHIASLDEDPDAQSVLAQRALIGPEALRRRVADLLSGGPEADPYQVLQRVRELCAVDHGDSRLDALTDLLIELWETRPDERVLIATQSDVAVEYLAQHLGRRLSSVGQDGEVTPLAVATLRRRQSGGHQGEREAALRRFDEGSARVLIAGAHAQVGFNLQRARVLVLYNVPWSPEEVEQWIGRLDRIGNAALSTEDGARDVELYTISQRGQVDARVVEVLERFGVLERSVDLDGDVVDEIIARIRDAALAPERVDWSRLQASAAAWRARSEASPLSTPLSAHLPWGVGHARAIGDRVRALQRDALEPRLTDDPREERALEAWLCAFGELGEYQVERARPDAVDATSRAHRVWYRTHTSIGGPRGFKGARSFSYRVALPLGEERWADHGACFTRRADLRQPPRVLYQSWDDSKGRPLEFFNHGGSLHEALVQGWLSYAGAARDQTSLCARYPEDHPVFEHAAPGEVFDVMLAQVDAGACLPADVAPPPSLSASLLSGEEARGGLLAAHHRALETARGADERWLRAALPAQLTLRAARWVEGEGRWGPLDDGGALAAALLKPTLRRARGEGGRRWTRPVKASGWSLSARQLGALMAARQALQGALREALTAAWTAPREDLEFALEHRRYALRVEARDALDALRAEAEREAQRLAADDNPRRRGLANRARDLLTLAEARWTRRDAWLLAARDRLRRGDVPLTNVISLTVQVERLPSA